jgi:glycosyltransferase involved in cell wall biosynthesis
MTDSSPAADPPNVERGLVFPTRVVELELEDETLKTPALQTSAGDPYRAARVVVKLHGKPLALVELNLTDGVLDSHDITRRVWSELEPKIAEHLRSDGVTDADNESRVPPIPRPPCVEARERARANGLMVSIVVATHDRPAGLARTLRSVIELDYPNYEIVVVDNAPATSETHEMLQRDFADVPNLHYVREDVPGLTPARIRGIEVASGEILAFTDDDVVVDRHWLAELVAGFEAGDSVACVTGLTLPLELDTPAQILFEEYGGFGKGVDRHIYNLSEHHPGDRLFPYAIGRIGSGNNMAWSRKLLEEIGGFDLSLTKTGAEDISAFFDAMTSGYTIVYEPAAIIFHEHRRSYADLRRQVYWYGIGLGAYLTRCLLGDVRHRLRFAAKAPFGLVYLLSANSPKNVKKSPVFPRELTRLELRGTWRGSLAYIRARSKARRRTGATAG